jgi:3-oxoacyl-[acyl-carrier-protein] synthase-3
MEVGMAVLGDGRHPGARLWSTVERYGNTSTASLPLAMAEAQAAGALVPGAKVLLLAGSAGVSAAAVTLVW